MGLCPFLKKLSIRYCVFLAKNIISYNYKENTIRVNIEIRENNSFFQNNLNQMA